MASDEEYRARIKAFADATGTTMAEFGQGLQQLGTVLSAHAANIGALAKYPVAEDPDAQERP